MHKTKGNFAYEYLSIKNYWKNMATFPMRQAIGSVSFSVYINEFESEDYEVLFLWDKIKSRTQLYWFLKNVFRRRNYRGKCVTHKYSYIKKW